MDQGMVWEKLLKVVLRENFPELLVFLFLIIITFWFKAPIKNLLQRIIRIKAEKSGVNVLLDADNEKPEQDRNYESAQDLLDAAGNSLVLSSTVAKVTNDLAAKNLSPDGERQILIKYLAATQLELAYESIYGWIYGTQIALLKTLNSTVVKQKKEHIQQYAQNILDGNPEGFRGRTAEQYIEPLKARSLIIEGDGFIWISDIGIDFLTWIVKNRRTEHKPY